MRLLSLWLILSFFFFLAFLGAQSEESDSPLPSISPSEKQFFQTVVEGNNHFAFDVYQNLKDNAGNFCFSSYSLASGLALAATGAKGETAAQFQRVLHYSLSLLPLIGDFNDVLHASTTSKNGSQVWLANAIWLQKDLPFLPSFKIALQRSFNVSLQPLDFAKESGKSIQIINQWTSQKTNGKIRGVVNGEDITTRTRFILTTAAYIKGQWAHPFDLRETKRLSFRVSRQRTFSANMMHNTAPYLLWKGEKWDMLVLPYSQDNQELQLAMAILLPKEIEIEELERNFTLTNWKQWLNRLQMQLVSLTLPRFRLEDRLDLQPLLKSLGLTSMFSPEADFSGIASQKELLMNEAIHKVLVNVEEKGTDAVSTNIRERKTPATGNETPYEFLADHPFIFVIWDQKTESILFMGRLSLP
jgi:serine protease inhibitor